MIKILKISIIIIVTNSINSCSQVLQSVELKINAEDQAVQQEFNVIEKTLTITETRGQNNTPYPRKVLQNGRGEIARSIPEKLALLSKFPKYTAPYTYKIGIGDTITLSRLIENNRSPSNINHVWPKQGSEEIYKLGTGDSLDLTIIKDSDSNNQMSPVNRGSSNGGNSGPNFVINSEQNDKIINSSGRIGSDGSVLLLEVGPLDARGKTLNDLRSEVRNILIRNGVSPRFQLEISKFDSQKAYLTVNNTSKVVKLDDQRKTVKDILTAASVGFKPGIITRIKLQRKAKEYRISLRDIYSEKVQDINVEDGDHIFVEDNSANISSSSSIVDQDGNIIFENVGKIEVAGFSLDEVQLKIESLLQKLPDAENAFQVQISKFTSQTALVNIPGETGGVIAITDNPISLEEVIIQSGLNIGINSIIRINLHRQGEDYSFTLDNLLKANTPKIYLRPDDHITVEVFPYKENKVFILGAVAPQIFKINPANRETLADALFTNGGALSSSSAQRSEVYLLRGKSPVVAYHLNAQSPTRLIVADAMELRPNDIIYVAEQPIISFNRTLATIVPLRILMRDIQNENIP